MPVKKRMMDALDAVTDSEGDTSDSEEDDKRPLKKGATTGRSAASKLTIEDLQRAGYKAGPSVLHVPDQPSKSPESSWAWSDGKSAKAGEVDDSHQERLHMRAATSAGVEESALYAKRVMQHSEKLRQEKLAEKEEKAKKRQLSFKEKEKRKRDAGMQASAKNYVEEEKRIAREHGCYSGFDS